MAFHIVRSLTVYLALSSSWMMLLVKHLHVCVGFTTTTTTTTTTYTYQRAGSIRRTPPLLASFSPHYYRDGDDHLSVSEAAGQHNSSATAVAETLNTNINIQEQQQQLQLQQQHCTTPDASSASMPLVNAIVFNQCTLLLFSTSVALAGSFFMGSDVSGLHWNGACGGSGDHHEIFRSLFDWHLSPLRIAEGIVAAIPMIALGCVVEQSDDRDASQVNFSTTNMVISLFGRRKSELDPNASDPSHVMSLSSGIAVSSGISEELLFRGIIPTAISSMTHSIPLALVGQAILFAAGHLSTHAKAGENKLVGSGENKLVGSLQLANGLWYGLVYLMAGGDILPCVIAHILYDMHTLCETWTSINDQMDYTQKASQNELTELERQAVRRLQQQEGGNALLGPETINFARRFYYAFDHDHAGSLSLKDVQLAVNYAFLRDKTIPDEDRVSQVFDQVLKERNATTVNETTTATRLAFSDFLKVLVVLRSTHA